MTVAELVKPAATPVASGWHRARVRRREAVAAEVWLFEIVLDDAAAYPWAQVAPGAHIDVELPGGVVRQYSLLTDLAADPQVLVIAVKRDAQGRGGSVQLCDQLQAGDALRVGAPRNLFALHADAAPAVLIAGGIGITPIWSMLHALQARQGDWSLHYAMRSRADAPFVEALQAQSSVHLHVDHEADGRPLDIARIVRDAPADAHLYCCGPATMLDAFEAACAQRDPARVHLERFGAAAPVAAEQACVVQLARANRTLTLPAGQTLLALLREAGVDVATSCEQGVCGACETAVLEGEIDHRDGILSPAEQAANRTMMVCCSLPKGPRLVLDL
jgi:ferredoxin-NADP reductase